MRRLRSVVVFPVFGLFAILPKVYQDSSVLVLPTLCDGFGMVVSEALANGLPVITTTNAGAADLIQPGRSGFVIPPANEDALVDALGWCADHPRDLFDMRRAALETAANWTWTGYRRRFLEALGPVLAPRPVAVGIPTDRVPVALS